MIRLFQDKIGFLLVLVFLFPFLKVSGQTYTVSTFAGSAGTPGFQNGVGANARFSSPFGLAIDPGNNVIVSEQSNHAIRKILPNGLVSTVAGNGVAGLVNGQGLVSSFTIHLRGIHGQGSGWRTKLTNGGIY